MGHLRLKLYLNGPKFKLQSKHKPLKYLKDARYQTDRVFHWTMSLQGYSFRVEDILGNRTLEHISGIRPDILVSGLNFVKHIFLVLWFNAILMMGFR